MENEELIRQRMERTRESITEKLDVLEERVTDSVQQASAAVTDTAASVKDAMDVKSHIDRHPWLMLGGAVAAGMLAGHFLFFRERRAPPERLEEPRAIPQPKAEQAPRPSPGPSLLASLEPEIIKTKELAIGVTLGIVREALIADMPPQLASCAGEIVDEITQKLGGRPLASSALPFVETPTSSGPVAPTPASAAAAG